MACRGNTCGVINYTLPKSWINGNAMVIHPKENSGVLKDYLRVLLPLLDFSSVITGAAQPQITRSTLETYKIPCPPELEQRNLANKVLDLQNEIDSAKLYINMSNKNRQDILFKYLMKNA